MNLTPAQIALTSLCGLLALAIAYEIYAPLPSFAIAVIPRQKSSMEPPPQPSFLTPPANAFDGINDRPIFSQSRKSVAPARLGAAAPPPPAPTVALIGVIIDSQGRLALVKTPGSPLETSVGVGGSIGGWQVTEIAPDRMVLHLGATDDEIKLESNRAKDAPSSATAPMNAPQPGVTGPAIGPLSSGPSPAVSMPTMPAAQMPAPASTNGTDKQN